jgi:hypothetical protein
VKANSVQVKPALFCFFCLLVTLEHKNVAEWNDDFVCLCIIPKMTPVHVSGNSNLNDVKENEYKNHDDKSNKFLHSIN